MGTSVPSPGRELRYVEREAEGEGFEPPVTTMATAHFECAPFNQAPAPLQRRVYYSGFGLMGKFLSDRHRSVST